MKCRIAVLGSLFAASTLLSHAQSNPIFVQFSPGASKGALYRPDSGPAPHVAILVMHRTSNVMSGLPTSELSKRGFMVLGMNPRFDNNEASVHWEDIALDVKQGVEFLRKQPGITKVVLLGGSGGGPTMSFYQAVAEKGPSYCQGANKLVQCGNNLAGLPKADGIIFRDAHPGISVNAIRGINPAVMDENDPTKIDPALDAFNPKNGYNPSGVSHYSVAFKKKYFEAQAARMHRLIDAAQARLQKIETNKDPYPDDDAFVFPRALGARLMELDDSIDPVTLKPQKLLKNDGTVSTQIVHTVRPPNLNMIKSNATFESGASFLTLRSFLSANAVRATDSMYGLDECSTNNSTRCALRQITVPILLGAMGAYIFIRDNEIHYEVAASKDKDFIVLEGALHGTEPCTACEKSPGQYSNSTKNFYDYVAKWINARF